MAGAIERLTSEVRSGQGGSDTKIVVGSALGIVVDRLRLKLRDSDVVAALVKDAGSGILSVYRTAKILGMKCQAQGNCEAVSTPRRCDCLENRYSPKMHN